MKKSYRFFDAAEEYYMEAEVNAQKDKWTRSTITLIQHATECYTKAILEVASEKSVYDIFPKGEVPHRTWLLFDRIKDYLREKNILSLLPYNRSIQNETRWTFYTYTYFRFPQDEDKTYSIKKESDIRDAMDTLNTLREYTKEFLNNYEQYLENQKESDELEF